MANTTDARLLFTDIKVLLEFNPNHSSRKHKYFEASRKREPKYKDYYLWHSGKILQNGTTTVPNNWARSLYVLKILLHVLAYLPIRLADVF